MVLSRSNDISSKRIWKVFTAMVSGLVASLLNITAKNSNTLGFYKSLPEKDKSTAADPNKNIWQ